MMMMMFGYFCTMVSCYSAKVLVRHHQVSSKKTPAPTSVLYNREVMSMERQNKLRLDALYTYSASPGNQHGFFQETVLPQLCHGCLGVPGICKSVIKSGSGYLCYMPTYGQWENNRQLVHSKRLCPHGFESCLEAKLTPIRYSYRLSSLLPGRAEYQHKSGPVTITRPGDADHLRRSKICAALDRTIHKMSPPAESAIVPKAFARHQYLHQYDQMYQAQGCIRLLVVGHEMLPLKPAQHDHKAHFTIYPPLPAGLSLDPATGVLKGMPLESIPTSTFNVI
jgi:hypothetical protein